MDEVQPNIKIVDDLFGPEPTAEEIQAEKAAEALRSLVRTINWQDPESIAALERAQKAPNYGEEFYVDPVTQRRFRVRIGRGQPSYVELVSANNLEAQ